MTMHEMVLPRVGCVNVPGEHIQVCDAQLALAWACKVFTTLETDVEYIVQTGGLVSVAWKRESI